MRAKKKKESESRSFRLRSDVLEQLDAYNESTGIPKTVIVEKALSEYLKDKVVLTQNK